jgi:hypothetical protein
VELGVGDPCLETSPVRTSLTILDDAGGSFMFSKNLVVDDRRRVLLPWEVDEDTGKPYRFRDLRVSWTSLDEPQSVRGSVGYLSNTGIQNFGHWMFFVYPTIEHYREYLGGDPDYYYLGRSPQSWHYDSLAALGIEPDRVLTDAVKGDRMVAALADYVVPTPTRFLDFSTNTLRKPRDRSKAGRRIYISRRLRPTRPFLNEDECLAVLERYGFETFCTEMLTLDEEGELFANADVVVAVHGAGLANLLFCHPGCVVVELFAHRYRSPWMVEVSAVRGITYSNVHGLPTGARGLRPMHDHLLVDPRALERVVKAAIDAVDFGDDCGPAGVGHVA